jgi:hypothetical protein
MEWRLPPVGDAKYAPGSLNLAKCATLALGAALILSIAGCGGSKHPQAHAPAATPLAGTKRPVALGKVAYEATMRRLGRRLATSVEAMYPLVAGRPGAEATKKSLAKVERTRAVATSLMTRLAAIVPPAPIRADHQRLARAVSDFRDELDQLIRVLEQGGSKPFEAYTRFAGLQAIAVATRDMNAKGYFIG